MATLVGIAAAFVAVWAAGLAVGDVLGTRARAALELILWLAVFFGVRRVVARARADAIGE